MTGPTILIHSDERGVATLTMNRPELHNAFDDQLIAELTAELKRLEADESVRVLLLAGSGKSFSAGADLSWMRRMAGYSREENLADAMGLAELMKTLNFLKMPTVALVQGAAYGGGVGLAAFEAVGQGVAPHGLAIRSQQFQRADQAPGFSGFQFAGVLFLSIGGGGE